MVMLKIISRFNLIYQGVMKSRNILRKFFYLTNKNPTVENSLLNLLRNRDDLKKWLLATGEYGRSRRS